MFDFSQQGQLTLAFGERDDGLLVRFANNGIHFPITHPAAAVYNRRSLADTAAIGKLAPPVVAAITLAPLLLTAQMRSEGAAGPLVILDIQS